MSVHSRDEDLLDYEGSDSGSPFQLSVQEQAKLLEEDQAELSPEKGDSSSSARVTEGPGASTNPSEASEDVLNIEPSEAEMEVDKTGSDVHMKTVANTPAPSHPGTVSESSPENGEFKLNLDGFGVHYLKALNDVLKVHRSFTGVDKIPKSVSWSPTVRQKKTNHVKNVSEQAYTKLIEALFLDRNVRFRGADGPQTQPPPTKMPSEQSTTSSPESFPCSCEAIHRSILACKVGKGHSQLCEEHCRKNATAISRRLSYSDAVASSPMSRPRSPYRQPPPQFHVPSKTPGDRSGRYEDRGRGKRSRSSSGLGSRHQPPKRDAREDISARQESYQHRRTSSYQSSERTTRPGTSKPSMPETKSPPKDTIPSASQFAALMSGGNTDIRLRDPTSGIKEQRITYSKDKVTTEEVVREPKKPEVPPVRMDQHGDVAVGPDGRIAYHRMPRRPEGLPEDVEYRVTVEKGCWCCQMIDKKSKW